MRDTSTIIHLFNRYNQHYNPDDSSRLFRQSCFRHMLFLTSIYLFIFWSWETWSRTNIGKTMFEQTAERTEKSNKCFRSGEYIRLGHETIQASTRRSSWFKNHPRAEPAAPAQVWGGVGLRYFNYAGRKRSDGKQTLEDVCNAHASLYTAYIYVTSSKIQEIHM